MPKPSKNNSPEQTIFQQVMKPSDWVKLAVLIVFSAACWLWVWRAYAQPFEFGSKLIEAGKQFENY